MTATIAPDASEQQDDAEDLQRRAEQPERQADSGGFRGRSGGPRCQVLQLPASSFGMTSARMRYRMIPGNPAVKTVATAKVMRIRVGSTPSHRPTPEQTPAKTRSSLGRASARGLPPPFAGADIEAFPFGRAAGAIAMGLPATGERILMAMQAMPSEVNGVGQMPARLRDASVLAGGDQKA